MTLLFSNRVSPTSPINITIKTDSGTYKVTGTEKITLESRTLTFNEISGTAVKQVTVTVDGSDTNVSGLSSGDGSIVLSSASATATPGAVSGISGDITLTASGSGTFTVTASGTLTAPQSSESALNSLTALEWTSPQGTIGGVTNPQSIKIEGSVSQGKFTITTVTVTAAD